MHPLIDPKMVQSIDTTGKAFETLPDRVTVLEAHGLPYDRQAENVIVSGCIVLSTLPGILRSLCRILDSGGLSYTFLSREYCCGNNLYRPAIKARDEEVLEECRELSREFIGRNIRRARELGAKRLIIFCSPCYPIYKHLFPDEAIVFYPQVISEVMGQLPFNESVDYYPGCYRLHARLSPAPMDLRSTEDVFSKLQGLRVRRIDAPKCCYTPEGLSHMVENAKAALMVHVCTGCYGQAIKAMEGRKGTKVLMLPELVERAIGL